ETVADVAGAAGEPVDLLVGHSLGALVALELVGRHPGFARGRGGGAPPGGGALVAVELVGRHPGCARRLVVEGPPGGSSVDWAGVAAGIEFDTGRAATHPEGLRRDLQAATLAWPPGAVERQS